MKFPVFQFVLIASCLSLRKSLPPPTWLSSITRQDPPLPADNIPLNAAQEATGLFHEGTLLAQILFCKAAFQTAGLQHLLVHGVTPFQVQDSAFPFVEFL